MITRFSFVAELEIQMVNLKNQMNHASRLSDELKKRISDNRRSLRGLNKEEFNDLFDELGDSAESILGEKRSK